MDIVADYAYTTRPTVSEIDLAVIRDNFSIIRRNAGKGRRIMAVVKADAYGHGASEVARALEAEGADLFGVAMLEEAVSLREAGIGSPVVILGGIIDGQESALFEYELTPLVFSIHTVRRIDAEGARRERIAKLHLKIDTGMGRVGIQPEEVKDFFVEVGSMKNVEIEGVATHFSSADVIPGSKEAAFTELQIERFKDCISEIESFGFHIPLIHAANSAAIFNFHNSLFNLVRPGIMLYGSYPSPAVKRVDGIKGAMSLRTSIIDLKDVEKGFTVSYGRTFVAKGRQKIAVIPVGYADGYRRELSNQGEALVRGKRAKVAGRVCMDMTMLDVSGIEGVRKGDDVYLFGGDGENAVTIDELARLAGTIPYEIMCGISGRVPRVYLDKGK